MTPFPAHPRSPLPRFDQRLVSCLLSLLASSLYAADPPPNAPVPPSPYLNVIYRFADAMLANGRDTRGPVQTALFLGALDRATLQPLTQLPPAPDGVQMPDRAGVNGANPQQDQNLLRLLYTLSGLSGETKYRAAADHELKWFLENTPSSATGLLPWGARMSWDTLLDEPRPRSNGWHEFRRPWLLWDRCFELAPDASARFARGLLKHHIPNPETGAFVPRARFEGIGTGNGIDSPRHAGFSIRTWAAAYAHTADDSFLRAIEITLRRYGARPDNPGGRRKAAFGPVQTLSLAIDCAGAAHHVPLPLSERLRAWVAKEDQLFCQLNHAVARTGGFLTSADPETAPAEQTSLWKSQPGSVTTAQMGVMCAARYYNGGGVGYRELILDAARAYLEAEPPATQDVWAMTLGHAISLQLAAWRCTADPIHLNRARHFGDIALQEFWENSPLPKASSKTSHYESVAGSDTLALALVELHLEILAITAVRAPANTIDR